MGNSSVFSAVDPGDQRISRVECSYLCSLPGCPGCLVLFIGRGQQFGGLGARTFYHLPYFNATMGLAQNQNAIDYSSVRSDAGTYAHFFAANGEGFSARLDSAQFQNLPQAKLEMSWNMGERLPTAEPGSIEFFLTERYCLYSYDRGAVYRSRIFHHPWPLQTASTNSCESTMIESLGIAQPRGEPLLHYAESISVDIWPLQRVSEARP